MLKKGSSISITTLYVTLFQKINNKIWTEQSLNSTMKTVVFFFSNLVIYRMYIQLEIRQYNMDKIIQSLTLRCLLVWYSYGYPQ